MFGSRFIKGVLLSTIPLTLAARESMAGQQEFLLVWRPPPGIVDGYRLYLGPTSGNYTMKRELGFVSTDDDGNARVTVALDAGTEWYVAMTAYDAAAESSLSNEFRLESVCDDDCTAAYMAPIVHYLMTTTP